MAYAAITKPSLHFKTKLFTGDGNATKAITGVGFQPDWVWIKKRNGVASHITSNVVSGVTKTLYTESTSAELTSNQYGWVSAFGTDGFTTTNTNANAVNGNGETYVSWNWKAGNSSGSTNNDGNITSTVSVNTTAGFSIITYTGTGSTSTVGHGLGVKPEIVIYKERNNANSWRVMHDIGGTLKRLYLNVSDAEASIIDSSTAPTASLLNIGTGSEVNRSSGTFVAYCFASKKGYSKFGRYRGNANANGVFVHTGFKPAFFISKRVDAVKDWHVLDNKRSTSNVRAALLYPNLTDAEATPTSCDFLSNGIKMRTANSFLNETGGQYIYMAFAENPFVANVGTSGTPVTAE